MKVTAQKSVAVAVATAGATVAVATAGAVEFIEVKGNSSKNIAALVQFLNNYCFLMFLTRHTHGIPPAAAEYEEVLYGDSDDDNGGEFHMRLIIDDGHRNCL